MDLLTTTPFGQRPVTSGLIERAARAQAPASAPHFNKWELFRELCTARAAYGVSDRDLTVLNALLTFHRDDNLSDNGHMIVFPSNRALSERAHGMAESTLRRHLAALVSAGLIHRHDSPNGKRYAARSADGEVARAFGFDLRPLLVNARDIVQAACEARAAADRLRRLREDISLMKRDALKLVAYGQESGASGDWHAFEARLLELHKKMRRKLPLDGLELLRGALATILTEIRRALSETEEMSGNDADIERHLHNSTTNHIEFELSSEKGKGVVPVEASHAPPEEGARKKEPNLPLGIVLKACPDILPYAKHDVRHWDELVSLAAFVRSMMGISPDAWSDAQRVMGPEVAAITVSAILQRVAEITSPGGYLRALTKRAANGKFSPGPMVMALLRPAAA